MKVKKRGAQKCTNTSDYFLLPFPTPHEFRIVESLPMGTIFALRWVPRKSDDGETLIVTNSIMLDGPDKDYAHISYELELDDPCISGNLYIDDQWVPENETLESLSLLVHLMIFDAVAREFECEDYDHSSLSYAENNS